MNQHHTPSSRRRALVIGASLAGLSATALLRKAGWSVEVFERSDVELFGRGAGITVQPELHEALVESGVDVSRLGVEITDRIAIDQKDRVIDRVIYPQIVTSWDKLHHLMRTMIPSENHHLGCNLQSVEQSSFGVTAYFANGRVERADLLIAADGYRSTVREIYMPEIQPIYAGYVIWRGVADENAMPKSAKDTIFDKFAFFLPPNNKIIGYPIPGQDHALEPGHRRYNWVWYRPVDKEALETMLVDESGAYHPVSISPAKVRQDLIDEIKRAAKAQLPPSFSDTLAAIARPFFTPIYDHMSPKMVFGRVVLIGDAASVGRPHIGMGVAKGASDAQALAAVLRDASVPIEQSLAKFEKDRLEVGLKAVERGRMLGEYLLLPHHSDSAPHDAHWKEFHSVNGILKNTASSEFLKTH
ncbi:FAD binding domain-containing protein [Paraburkholderia sp. GAS334]|uniref:FAD binding domain-containing protein n=1 Tax=Paraburkholderia sp. GAS334 TaxID=3035131 RepID=UPI003D21BF70